MTFDGCMKSFVCKFSRLIDVTRIKFCDDNDWMQPDMLYNFVIAIDNRDNEGLHCITLIRSMLSHVIVVQIIVITRYQISSSFPFKFSLPFLIVPIPKSFHEQAKAADQLNNSNTDSQRGAVLNRNGGLNHGDHAKRIAQLLLSPTSLILSDPESSSWHYAANRRQSTLSETVSAVSRCWMIFCVSILLTFLI